MTLVEATLLGVIEGLTEFFPISSTGHLIIAEKILGVQEPSLFFNTIIQLGAICAVFVSFWSSIRTIITNALRGNIRRMLLFALASLPVLVVGALFHSVIKTMQNSVLIVAVASIAVALFMLYVERKHRKTLLHNQKAPKNSAKDFFTIGLFQALSVIPGVSRSGITVVGGMIQNYTFADSVETAFILGIPAMGAASAYELLLFLKHGEASDPTLLVNTAVGFGVSFVVAWAAIAATLPIFKKYGLMPFVIYRILLGVILLMTLR
ncbi:MAG TPA: undecaprenyl-diphosphate phosphatase [Patescibacteria group bacterium]|nr:undecaprenyl-diphosphate phosphatase [Patescibacteria group bacterium]